MLVTHVVVILALSLAGCSPGPGDAIPEIPELTAEGLPESVRTRAQSLIDGLAANPDDPWANGDLARLLHAHKRVPEARDLYRRAASLSGDEFRWIYLLGIAQQESEHYAQAASSFGKALNTRPYGPAWIRLGESLAAEQQFGAAVDALRTAAEIEGNDAYVSYALGKVLLELGETAEALELLESAVSLAPDSGGPAMRLPWPTVQWATKTAPNASSRRQGPIPPQRLTWRTTFMGAWSVLRKVRTTS